MRIIRTVAEMQGLSRHWRIEEKAVGLVPTMGALHAGHISLVRRARRVAGQYGLVVVSVYVNPLQFGPKEDFAHYPRDLEADARLCADAKVDVLFAPSDAEMYPDPPGGGFSTVVFEEKISRAMEGARRPSHFRGVTTVVAKLFNIIQPDVAVFGAKDFQQAAIIRRMTRDLNFPVQIELAPTQREEDGLALSSRNRYLNPEERAQATILWRAIETAKQAVTTRPGGVLSDELKHRLAKLIETQPLARVDYVELFDSLTFEPVEQARQGTHLALAVFVGRTRLIDNAQL